MWAKIRATPWETGEERTQALKGRTNRRSGGPRCHYLATVCDNAGCHAYRIGGTEDHVHILFLLSRTKAVSDLVEEAKTASSRWIKLRGNPKRRLRHRTP
ncbi:MAG: hypothetical protein FJ291_34070 [Planctomycetes bacterium]|nr:hypothetical protein [Planctomycetota bacterium]